MIRLATFVLCGALLLLPRGAIAAARLPAFEPGETAAVREVVDGMDLVLEDGRVARLAGIEAPHAATAENRRAWPFADKAKAALAALVAGKTVELRYAGNHRDRHGRLVAHLFVGKKWVQGELLRRGLVRVAGTADNRIGLAEMLARENRARLAQRGLWRDPFYGVRTADEAGRYSGSFQIVEGRIVDAAAVDGQLFLNFGADWKSAFSLHFTHETMQLFRGESIDAGALKGERVRVRGWIHGAERPVIDITFPEQIERF